MAVSPIVRIKRRVRPYGGDPVGAGSVPLTSGVIAALDFVSLSLALYRVRDSLRSPPLSGGRSRGLPLLMPTAPAEVPLVLSGLDEDSRQMVGSLSRSRRHR